MKNHYISLIPDGPKSFEYRQPTKRDLLSGSIALFADSLESCIVLMDRFCERVAGLIITRGNDFSYSAIGPHLWHIQITADSRYELDELAQFYLCQITATRELNESNLHLNIELDRIRRELDQSITERSNNEKYLWKKVQTLREEIKKRKQTETELQLFKAFADASNQGVRWANTYGKIVYHNPALAQLLTGDKSHQLTGNSILESYSEKDQQRIVNEAIPTLRQTGAWSGELTIRQIGTGELIPTKNDAFLIHDKHTETDYMANIIVDLREQNKIEKERIKVKKLESVGFLAGGIAHDFNNLLSGILGNIDLAIMDLDPTTENYQLLMEAKKASIRAKGLTQQLLTFSKGGAPVRQETKINAIILESSNFILHGKAVACHYDIPDDLRAVNADTDQISQVIQNLIINACNAMPENGTIQISCENMNKPCPLQPSMKSPIKITISDTGCGIPQEHIDKIFDPYFSTNSEGSGLGLAICNSIIGKHGGTISAQSIPDVGTTFTIYLPGLLVAKPATKATRQDAAPTKNRKRRILVMDDEPIILTITERMLSRLGHNVFVSKNGKEAIRIFSEQQKIGSPINITIMDLTIPGGMGGKEAVHEIKKLDPDAFVIVSSGYSDDPIMANCKDFGFSASIAKPFEIDELIALIDSHPI